MRHPSPSDRLVLLLNPHRDHIRGAEDDPVTIVEYADYECPYCAVAHQSMKEVLEEAGDDLRFVFRNFPLADVHPRAIQAAEAAEAASAQGKFWDMNDVLLTNQENLDLSDLLEYAENLGLNLERFEHDLRLHVFLDRIQQDVQSGLRSGVTGTPSFFSMAPAIAADVIPSP